MSALPTAAPPDSPETRLAALAFADIVGWSVLAAADESVAVRRWLDLFRARVRPAAEGLGGRVVDVHGDGVLCEFPCVPDALEWARRVHAAAEASAGPDEQPIAFRVAIHLGQVIADGPRVFGDAVNLAARLQEFGTPGGVVLSADAAAALPERDLAGARDLGDLPLRNMSRAVRAVALDPARRAAVPLPPAPTLLPSVAVLPLENLGGDPADDYFAAGLVEDIAASLAGLHEVFVIAPESARMFAGQCPTPQRVGRTLGVRYAVMGGVRRAGGGLRASLRLLDTATGEQLWGERIEAAEREVFDLQDHVTSRVVAGVAPNIRAAALREAMRKRPESLTAYDHMLRGVHAMAAQDRDAFVAAREHLARAARADPGFALPLAWTAQWHHLNIGFGWSECRAADFDAILAHGRHALGLDPRNGLALAFVGHNLAFVRHDVAAAQEMLELALEASPGNWVGWTLSSATLSYTGQGADAVRHAERGLRLAPYSNQRFYQDHFLAIAHYAAGDLGAALRPAQRSLGAHARHAAGWRLIAAILGGLGRADEAAAAGRRMLDMEPDFRVGPYITQRMPFVAGDLRERFARDLRAARLPE